MANRNNPLDQVVRLPAPHLLRKRFTLPAGCSVGSFVMRELTGPDELEAAMWADKKMDKDRRSDAVAVMEGEQREAMRLAFTEVDGEPVNHDGIPFVAMDLWTYRTMRFAQTAFSDVNGVQIDELQSFKEGAELVMGPESLPTHQEPAATTGG